MDAVQFVEHGDRGVVTYGSYPEPSPDSGEVLVVSSGDYEQYLHFMQVGCE